jgi:hypothetical protein
VKEISHSAAPLERVQKMAVVASRRIGTSMLLAVIFLEIISVSLVAAFQPRINEYFVVTERSRNDVTQHRLSRSCARRPRSVAVSSSYSSSDGSSSGPPTMPYREEKMPFYALGINWAIKLGGDGNLKSIMSDEQLEVLLQGTLWQSMRSIWIDLKIRHFCCR